MPLDHSCQTGQHSFLDRGHDAYSTPPVAVEALLTVEALPYHIWECAAGRGNIVRTLREAGHKVIASDILHYDFPLDFEGDFLDQVRAPTGTELILNKPAFQGRN